MSHDQLGRVLTIVAPLGRTALRTYSVPSSSGWTGPDLGAASANGTLASTNLAGALNPGDYQIGTNGYDLFGTTTGVNRSRGFPQVSAYRDATLQVSYGHAWDDAGRLTERQDRSGLPIASAQPFSNGGTGLYDEREFSYTANLPASLPLTAAGKYATGNYDSSGYSYNAEYDATDISGRGNNGSMVDTTYTRDALGRVTGISPRYEFADFFVGPALTYSYRADGRLASATYGLASPSGFPANSSGGVAYTYDGRGLVQAMGAATFAYDAAGRNVSMTVLGVTRTQQFDNEGRVTSRCYRGTNGLQRCYTATYDAVGNPVQLGDPEGTDVIAYDALDRITSVTRGGQLIENYAYNAMGALATNAGVALDQQRPTIANASVFADSALPKTFQGSPVAVDLGGHVTAIAGTTFTYDPWSRVKTISGTTPLGAATEKRGYDAQGRVAAQSRTLTGSGETINTYNFYDGANLVEQWVSDSASGGLPSAGVNQFVYEGVDQPIYASLGSSSVVYELDLAGNVRRIRLAADGTDLGGYRYTAFGQVYPADGATLAPTTPTGTAFTASTQPLQWKGRPAVDFGGGFYDMRARWWSPQLGAFTSVDELVYQDARSTLWGGRGRIR